MKLQHKEGFKRLDLISDKKEGVHRRGVENNEEYERSEPGLRIIPFAVQQGQTLKPKYTPGRSELCLLETNS